MDIDKMIIDLDSYFANTPKEHFEEVWNKVKKYEAYGPNVDEFLNKDSVNTEKDAASYTRLTSHPRESMAI